MNYRLLIVITIILSFFNIVALAEPTYIIAQKTKSCGHSIVSVNSHNIKISFIEKNIEVFSSTPDFKVLLINHKSKKYFITNIGSCRDVSGQKNVLSMLISGGSHTNDKNYWIFNHSSTQDGYKAFIYKFKISKPTLNKACTFEELKLIELPKINKNFFKLHANLFGAPYLGNFDYLLSAYDTNARLFHFIGTSSIVLKDISLSKPIYKNYKLAKSYEEFHNISNNKNLIMDLIDLGK